MQRVGHVSNCTMGVAGPLPHPHRCATLTPLTVFSISTTHTNPPRLPAQLLSTVLPPDTSTLPRLLALRTPPSPLRHGAHEMGAGRGGRGQWPYGAANEDNVDRSAAAGGNSGADGGRGTATRESTVIG